VPPLSSIISQPAAVFGMDRSAEPVVAPRSAAVIVLRPEVVLGCMVDWLCAVIVLGVVAGDWVADWLASACWPSVVWPLVAADVVVCPLVAGVVVCALVAADVVVCPLVAGVVV